MGRLGSHVYGGKQGSEGDNNTFEDPVSSSTLGGQAGKVCRVVPRSVPLGRAQRRKAHFCWCRRVHRCVGAYRLVGSGSHSDSYSCRPKDALKRGRTVTSRPSRSPTPKGLALVPCVFIGLHYYGTVLLEGITRRQWATHRVPGPHHTRGRKIFTMTSQRSSRPVASDCIIFCCLRLLADRLHGCTLSSSLSAQGVSRAPMAGSRSAVGCCDSLVVCVAQTVESLRRRFTRCQC